MEEKKQIKVSLGTVICIVIIFILIIALILSWSYYKLNEKEGNNVIETNSNSEQSTTTEESKKSIKIDNTKEYVYDANYTYGDLEGKSYTSGSMEETYSLDDIVYPYININSEDAKKFNKEINDLFDESAKWFQNELEGEQVDYVISNYKYYINNKTLSIIITEEAGGSDVPVYTYHTYNFDLETGKELSYEDVYKRVGFTAENIDDKVENAIKKYKDFDLFEPDYVVDNMTIEDYKEQSVKNYEDSIMENTIRYFIDKNKKINVIVTIEIPAGVGHFDRIITIE